ncbi:MAG TPA: TonB-dependent receptor [Bacteroidales bacterium]|nr:TonB-dependent receptor [Bacteroidales bacterium]HQI69878.1 TonB-dependent receptor [Bacteroidales bacterium]
MKNLKKGRFSYRKALYKIAVLWLFFFFPNKLFSQTDSANIYDLNLSQLTKLKITSASKSEQFINEIPSTIYIITAAEIQERGYFTLDEALADLPGFQFRNTLGINSYVFQRGIPNQNNLTLVLIDGVQINELNSGGFYGGAQYNLANVERIEVIYGPASVVYGTNAVSGIINIITKDYREPSIGINTLIGNFYTSAGDVCYSYINKKETFGLRLSGMFKRSEKADLKRDEGDNNWTGQMDNIENDYSFDVKIQFKNFTLGTNYQLKQPTLATSNKSVGTIYRDYGTIWNMQFINNYLKYDKKISNKLCLSSMLYNRNSTVLNNSVYSVVDTAQVGYYRPNNLIGTEHILNYKPKDFFSLTSGLVFDFEQLSEKASLTFSDSPDNKPPRPPRPNVLNNYLLSVFTEPTIILFKKLYVSAGLRFDQSSIYNQVLTPRVGLIYHFRKHFVRISYAEAFRAPKPWDYYDGAGNSSLQPEKMRSLELGLTFSIIDKIKIVLVGYRNLLFNAINKEYLINNYRWVNSGLMITHGSELFLRLDFGKIKGTANYTFTYATNESGFLVPEISMHSGNASITYSLNKYFKINLNANYYSKRKNPQFITAANSYYIKPYVLIDATLSMLNYKGISVQIIVKNLLDTKYYHTSNRAPERYRQPQFTFLFTVGYSLDKLYLKK